MCVCVWYWPITIFISTFESRVVISFEGRFLCTVAFLGHTIVKTVCFISAVILWMKATHSDLVLQAVVCSDDESLREMVEVAVHRLHDALSPTCDVTSRGRSQQWRFAVLIPLPSWFQRNHLQEADEQIVFLPNVCFVDDIRRKINVCFHEFLFLYS